MSDPILALDLQWDSSPLLMGKAWGFSSEGSEHGNHKQRC